jgi:uncharacterized protein DUF4339
MRVTCDRCLRRYDVPDAALKGRKIRARCKCGARIVIPSLDGASPDSSPESKGRPTRWFVDITSWEPITMDMRQLVRAFSAGRIDADTLVWCKGMPDWRRLRDVDELAERLLGMTPGGASRPSRPPPPPPSSDAAPEPPARMEVMPARSRTPQASYFVPSAGDTVPLQRPALVADAASAEPSDEVAGSPSLLDELDGKDGSAANASDRPSDFPPDLEAALADATRDAPPLEATPEARPVEASSPSTTYDEHDHGASEPPALEAGATRGDRAVFDRESAAAELFAAPDSVRAVEATSVPEESNRSEATSKPISSGPSASEPASAARAAARADSSSREAPPPAAAKAARGRNTGRSRRRSSSEETPAQKPSSLSVPPRSPRAHRGRRVMAVVGTLAVIWVVGRATMEESTKPVSTSHSSDSPEVTPPALQLPGARPSRDEAAAPLEASKPSDAPIGEQTPRAADAQRAVDPLPPQAQATAALKPATPPVPEQKPVAPPPAAKPAPAVAAPAPSAARPTPPPVAPPAPAPKRVEPPAPAAPKPPIPTASLPPVSTTDAPAVPPPAPVSPAPKPGPFDMDRAEQQMTLAAQAAARCGQAGPQRGAGQVKVLVEPWGRVVRVTHLEQGYVGTPVGICVMQAYQQLQVPPFEGGTRSLIGSFEVK